MLLDLDSEASLDPARVGLKAAWLARARAAGLPVLPGFVVEGEASQHHMQVGATALGSRGSGGARLAVGGEPLDFTEALIASGRKLGSVLVARSATMLEGAAEWAGAFTSYLDLAPVDLPKGVVGCWASAFSVDALDRQAAAGIEPGSFPMAVLVQPALIPEAGGTAEIDTDGSVVVHGIAGSPAPLLTGWSVGLRDAELAELIGEAPVAEISRLLTEANMRFGAAHCEWALDRGVWILQLGAAEERQQDEQPVDVGDDVDPAWLDVVAALVRAGDPLGEELILPWALGGMPRGPTTPARPEPKTLDDARSLSRELAAGVWDMEVSRVPGAVDDCLRRLHGPDPGAALATIKGLKPADPDRAGRLLAGIEMLRAAAPAADRRGRGRWEPLIAAVVLAAGERRTGIPASPGIGSGFRAHVPRPGDTSRFSPRDVVVAGHPLPFVAPLLWDAAGLVTTGGSPAAHLFRSARALGVPAVCGVDIEGDRDHVVAVDGSAGVAATIPL